ncbi:MAG: protein translocase SEC61 complex subunit gamma [Candidatus Nanoarchaeia archaeon]|nr:protein translocase SEC61 complex subunit gamma [Candidatus Nanoarchaeia archaeon]
MKLKLKLNIREKLSEYKRIIKIARKPTMEEFKRVSYVTAISTLIIGLAGFVIELLMQLIGGI